MAEPVSPVIPGLEPYEIEFGKGQEGFLILPALRGRGPGYPVSSRWRLSNEERAAVAAGADIIITQLTFGNRFQATHISAVMKEKFTEVELEEVIAGVGLKDELDERIIKGLVK